MDVDPGLAAVQRLEDPDALERERILMFFREYERIPTGADVEVGDFEDVETARRALAESGRRYREERARRP